MIVLADRLHRQFPEQPREDWHQDLLLETWRRFPLFDPARGKPTTFVSMRYKFLAWRRWRRKTAAKHKGASAPCVSLSPDDDGVCYEVSDHRAADPGDAAERHEAIERVAGAAKRLRPRDRKVLKQRFGLDGSEQQTLHAISLEMGVSLEMVRQYEAEAVERIGDMLD
jgi:RNA polymerase primary sigma factor